MNSPRAAACASAPLRDGVFPSDCRRQLQAVRREIPAALERARSRLAERRNSGLAASAQNGISTGCVILAPPLMDHASRRAISRKKTAGRSYAEETDRYGATHHWSERFAPF